MNAPTNEKLLTSRRRRARILALAAKLPTINEHSARMRTIVAELQNPLTRHMRKAGPLAD